MGIYEEFFHGHFFDENGAIDQFAFLKPDEEKPGKFFCFRNRIWRRFLCKLYWFCAENQLVKIITEFIEIKSE